MEEHWQIQLFNKSLKKKQKLFLLNKIVNPNNNQLCLDLGCTTGTISYFLRKKGGKWIHTDLELKNLENTKDLIQDNKIFQLDPMHMPLRNEVFDLVVSLDLIEHLDKDIACVHEVFRVLKPNGTFIVSAPAVGPFYVINHLKRWVGMTPEKYGHVREGYTERKIRWILDSENFDIIQSTTYSKFFTEFLEFLINFFYSKLAGNKQKTGYKGSITPSSKEDVKKSAELLAIYKFIYPITWFVSQLDKLLFFNKGYAHLIVAKKVADRKSTSNLDTHPTF